MSRPVNRFPVPNWHTQFLSMLPRIRDHAAVSFRHLNPEAREEAIQEVVCNALKAYVRLVQIKKVELAYPSVLATFGVAQVKDGRKVGSKLNVRDVSSQYAQRQKGFSVGRLDHYNDEDNSWQEILVEDKTAGPAEVVATKIDFTQWLKMLPSRARRIAKLLATGELTSVVARKFNLSAGRISQMRKKLAQAWKEFQGETDSTAAREHHEELSCPAA